MKKRRTILPFIMGNDIHYIILIFSILTSIYLYLEYIKQQDCMEEMVFVKILHEDLDELNGMIKELVAQNHDDWTSEISKLRQKLNDLQLLICKEEKENILTQAKAIKEEIRLLRKKIDIPPIISLEEAEGFNFESGSADISAEFEKRVTVEIVPKITRISNAFKVDQIEIIGHTDEVPISSGISNLDKCLVPFINCDKEARVYATDNVGLGMARAAAIARILSGRKELKNITIIPLSAGQLVDPSGRVTKVYNQEPKPEEKKRRIDIRLKRSEITK